MMDAKGQTMKARRREAGFTLLELIIAVAVMVLALITMMVAITSASKINDNARERAIAYELAKSKIEEIRNFTKCSNFTNIFYYYGYTPSVTTPNPKSMSFVRTTTWNGNTYTKDTDLPDPFHLNPITINGVDQPIMYISFPVNAAGTLDENPTVSTYLNQKLGMPKDLNRNGVIGDNGSTLFNTLGSTVITNAPATAYKILPLMVTVQWKSAGGKSAQVEIATYIADK